MKMVFALLLCFSSMNMAAFADFTALHTCKITDKERTPEAVIWRKENVNGFDELLLSWKAKRPETGNYLFLVRVKTADWSPWMRYAEWGKDVQKSFSEDYPEACVKIFQDTVNTQKDVLGTGFEVKALALEGANLKDLEALYVCTSNFKNFAQHTGNLSLESVRIPAINGQSQIILPHPRGIDMCSPTSTSTVINFLLGSKKVDPLDFASHVRDMGFDIYGNWALNVAEANNVLKDKYSCRIERLNGFEHLHSYLKKNIPVVVSVKGPIPGAPLPYNYGHLMVVMGFNQEEQRVYCVDSAYDSNDKTIVSYALADFLKAWGTRRNLAYVFKPSVE